MTMMGGSMTIGGGSMTMIGGGLTMSADVPRLELSAPPRHRVEGVGLAAVAPVLVVQRLVVGDLELLEPAGRQLSDRAGSGRRSDPGSCPWTRSPPQRSGRSWLVRHAIPKPLPVRVVRLPGSDHTQRAVPVHQPVAQTDWGIASAGQDVGPARMHPCPGPRGSRCGASRKNSGSHGPLPAMRSLSQLGS